jgi:hypothetical protein
MEPEGKHLSDSFPIQEGLKQGDALAPLLFNLIECPHFIGVGLYVNYILTKA